MKTTEQILTETLQPLITAYAGVLTTFNAADTAATKKINTAVEKSIPGWEAKKAEVDAAKAAIDAALPADCDNMTIPTLAGKFTIRRTPSLEIADEDATVEKLERLAIAAAVERKPLWNVAAIKVLGIKQPEAPEPSIFVRTKKEPNRETLGSLADDMLAHLGVRRVTKISWTFTPHKLK